MDEIRKKNLASIKILLEKAVLAIASSVVVGKDKTTEDFVVRDKKGEVYPSLFVIIKEIV